MFSIHRKAKRMNIEEICDNLMSQIMIIHLPRM